MSELKIVHAEDDAKTILVHVNSTRPHVKGDRNGR